MPKGKIDYCRICRLVVAPRDPGRLERHGRTAHEACVLNHALLKVREEAGELLARLAVTFTVNYFATETEGVRGRQQLARMLSVCLNMALAEPRWRGNESRRLAIENFARYAANQLFIDVPIAPE